MSTLTRACCAVNLRDVFERPVDSLVGVKANLVHEAVQSLRIENTLRLAEHCLDRVEFRAVGDVVDRCDVELLVLLSHIFLPVHCQVIHEQRYSALAMFFSQPL